MFINIWLEQILNSLFPLKGNIDVKIQVCQRSCIHLRRGLLLGGGTWGGGEGRCRGGGGAGGRGTARTAPPSPPPASARAAPWRDTSRPSSWLARSLGGRPHLCTWHHWPLSHGLLTSSTPHYHCHSLALDQAAISVWFLYLLQCLTSHGYLKHWIIEDYVNNNCDYFFHEKLSVSIVSLTLNSVAGFELDWVLLEIFLR